MKNLLCLFLVLVSLSTSAQKPVAATPPASVSTSSLSGKSAQATSPNQVSELDYYKKMYELAKAEADRAHADIWAGYAVNVGFLLALALFYIAGQWFNIRRQLSEFKKLVDQDIAQSSQSVRTELDEKITALHNQQQGELNQVRVSVDNVDFQLYAYKQTKLAGALSQNESYRYAVNEYCRALEYGINRENADSGLLGGLDFNLLKMAEKNMSMDISDFRKIKELVYSKQFKNSPSFVVDSIYKNLSKITIVDNEQTTLPNGTISGKTIVVKNDLEPRQKPE